MICDNLCSIMQRRDVITILAGILFATCVSAISVEAASEAPAEKQPGGVSYTIKRVLIDSSTAAKDPEVGNDQVKHEKKEKKSEAKKPAAASTIAGPGKSNSLPRETEVHQ